MLKKKLPSSFSTERSPPLFSLRHKNDSSSALPFANKEEEGGVNISRNRSWTSPKKKDELSHLVSFGSHSLIPHMLSSFDKQTPSSSQISPIYSVSSSLPNETTSSSSQISPIDSVSSSLPSETTSSSSQISPIDSVSSSSPSETTPSPILLPVQDTCRKNKQPKNKPKEVRKEAPTDSFWPFPYFQQFLDGNDSLSRSSPAKMAAKKGKRKKGFKESNRRKVIEEMCHSPIDEQVILFHERISILRCLHTPKALDECFEKIKDVNDKALQDIMGYDKAIESEDVKVSHQALLNHMKQERAAEICSRDNKIYDELKKNTYSNSQDRNATDYVGSVAKGKVAPHYSVNEIAKIKQKYLEYIIENIVGWLYIACMNYSMRDDDKFLLILVKQQLNKGVLINEVLEEVTKLLYSPLEFSRINVEALKDLIILLYTKLDGDEKEILIKEMVSTETGRKLLTKFNGAFQQQLWNDIQSFHLTNEYYAQADDQVILFQKRINILRCLHTPKVLDECFEKIKDISDKTLGDIMGHHGIATEREGRVVFYKALLIYMKPVWAEIISKKNNKIRS